jgi:hypothetical protein
MKNQIVNYAMTNIQNISFAKILASVPLRHNLVWIRIYCI